MADFVETFYVRNRYHLPMVELVQRGLVTEQSLWFNHHLLADRIEEKERAGLDVAPERAALQQLVDLLKQENWWEQIWEKEHILRALGCGKMVAEETIT